MIDLIVKDVTKKIDYWFTMPTADIIFNESNTLEDKITKLAAALFGGWHCDWMMNSDDKNTVFIGTKKGIECNTQRNRMLEQIEKHFVTMQKGEGEPTAESVAMAIDKLIVTYMKIINSKNEISKHQLENQYEFILTNVDRLIDDLISGKKQTIAFSHLKEYM